MIYIYIQWPVKVFTPTNDETFTWYYELCRNNFSKCTFLFITKVIKLNTVLVEWGYMSGTPVKHVQIKIHWLYKYSEPLGVSWWWKKLLEQGLWWVFVVSSPQALHSEMVKSLSILHVKIARVLPSLMGIIDDGLQSSSIAVNVSLDSSQDFDWANQEHLFSSYSATPVWFLCFESLSSWNVNLLSSLIHGWLKQVFNKDSPVHCSFYPDKLASPCWWKAAP